MSIRLCLVLVSALGLGTSVLAHEPASMPRDNPPGREISFPDTADRLTLSVDLHTHSVFSDGHVWPRIRVGEAIRDGLDGLAITEHLEWQPHLADIPHEDRNRAYEEALASVPAESDLIVIAGSEITRSEPIGHLNAVFISDANALLKRGTPTEPFDMRDYYVQSGQWPAEEALAAADAQGAFVFWNHAWWQLPNQMAAMTEFHIRAVDNGMMHGIEIANGGTYSPEAFQIALDYDLTLVGVSDVHNLIDWDYPPHQGDHRPVNLVLAKERSADSIREALMAGHTVVWFKNLLFGRERDLMPLLEASLQVVQAGWRGESSVLELELRNTSDADYVLETLSAYTLVSDANTLIVPAHSSDTYRLRVSERAERLRIPVRIRNALTAPDTYAEMTFEISLPASGSEPGR